MNCEICDYKDTSKAQEIVIEDIDGVNRCTVCRHMIRYGRYVHSDREEVELYKSGKFTDEWKAILLEFGQ